MYFLYCKRTEVVAILLLIQWIVFVFKILYFNLNFLILFTIQCFTRLLDKRDCQLPIILFK